MHDRPPPKNVILQSESDQQRTNPPPNLPFHLHVGIDSWNPGIYDRIREWR